MAKLVVLKLGEGDWEHGFPVILQIGEEGDRPSIEVVGKLPGAPEIPLHYDQWRSAYRRLPLLVRMTRPKVQVTNVSKPQDCRQAAQVLRNSLNDWLNSERFRPLKERLLEKVKPSDFIRIIIQTSDFHLRRLPWHLWDFFERYPHAEVALSAPVYEEIEELASSKNQFRILAILGDREGIDIEADRKFLESLPGAKTVFLVEPPRRDISEQLWEQDWDILFFAGHSRTEGECGRIYINQSESLTIGELKHGLRKAIKRGLQLAVFNSCDGLGLARELEDLHIPQVIVMREPVPDKVAQEFLKYFLNAFSQSQSLYMAVRTARERLYDAGLESEIPGVTWLPMICQNPAEMPLAWPRSKKFIFPKTWLSIGIATSAAALLIVSVVTPHLNSFLSYQSYKNDDYRIGIKYPKDWEAIKEEKLATDDTKFFSKTGNIAKFVAPQENSSDPFREYILISVYPLESPTTLHEYSEETVTQISNDQTSAPVKDIPTKLADSDARQVDYTTNEGEQTLKTRLIWTVKNNQAYVIAYTVEENKFSKFEKIAQEMIESFEIY